MVVQVPPIVGFGFCPAGDGELEGRQRFQYRYTPPSICDLAPEAIIGALNQSAVDGNRASALTAEGRARFEALPLFGALEVTTEGLEWTSYWNEDAVVTLSGTALEDVIETALRTSPMHLWANRHLEGLSEALEGLGEPTTAALAMCEGEHGVPVLDAIEATAYPFGPLKVLLLSPNPQMIDTLRSQGEGTWELLAGSIGVLRKGSMAIEYSPWTFLRLEIPITLVPHTLQWAESDEFKRSEAWGAPAVMPSGEWDMPRLIVGREGPNSGILLLTSGPEELDAETLGALESAIRTEASAP